METQMGLNNLSDIKNSLPTTRQAEQIPNRYPRFGANGMRPEVERKQSTPVKRYANRPENNHFHAFPSNNEKSDHRSDHHDDVDDDSNAESNAATDQSGDRSD